jgi:hypothetical protein
LSQSVMRYAASLASLILPARYNALFETADENGQFTDRLEVVRAIVDWADQDNAMFGSPAVEDYRYNSGSDPYETKNHYYDTVEELRLVKGVGDDFMDAFADQFTVYGDCKINLNLVEAPILLGILVQNAIRSTDKALLVPNIYLLARVLIHIRDYYGGFPDVKTFIMAAGDPIPFAKRTFTTDQKELESLQLDLPQTVGLALNGDAVAATVVAGGPRRIWRVVATAKVGRIQKRITAIWDMKHISMQAQRSSQGQGGFLYWREE